MKSIYKQKAVRHESGLYIFEGMTEKGYYWLMMFNPKAEKPFCNVCFKTNEDRETYKLKQIKLYHELLELRAKQKAARKVTPEKLATLKIGDIFNWTWGYEQTNQNYYQLVEIKGQYGIFREIAQEREETGWLQGNCRPLKDKFISEPFKKKIQFQDNKPFIKMDSFGWCNLWDGETDYYTSYH